MSFLPIGVTANLILNRLKNQIQLIEHNEKQREHDGRADRHQTQHAEQGPDAKRGEVDQRLSDEAARAERFK